MERRLIMELQTMELVIIWFFNLFGFYQRLKYNTVNEFAFIPQNFISCAGFYMDEKQKHISFRSEDSFSDLRCFLRN